MSPYPENRVVQLGKGLRLLSSVCQPEDWVCFNECIHNHMLHCIRLPAPQISCSDEASHRAFQAARVLKS